MIAKDIITENIVRTENVSASDADNSVRRVRHLEWLTEVASDFYYSHDHSWSYYDGTVTVSGGENLCPVPNDFHSLGQYGSIILASTGVALRYVSPQTMRRIQALAVPTANPIRYSLFGNLVRSVTAGQAVLECVQTELASGSVALSIHYRGALPAITDTAFDSSDIDPIQYIPDRYHQWVLMPGMRALALASVGDSKGNPLQTDPAYQAAKRLAIAADMKGKEQGFQFPSFFQGEYE